MISRAGNPHSVLTSTGGPVFPLIIGHLMCYYKTPGNRKGKTENAVNERKIHGQDEK